jgi:protein O-mannosyl-transferase
VKTGNKRSTPTIKPSPNSPNPKRRDLAAAAGLCLLTLLVFANSFGTGFPLDNKGLILDDARVHAATQQNVSLIFGHSYWWPRGAAGLYRPFTTLSYLFNYAILGNGDRPEGYHWINILLHLASVLLVYAIARKLMSDFWPAVWLAALWAVHPVLTESVTNIIGRADLLAGAALLGGFLLYLKSAEAAGWKRAIWLAGLMTVTAIGVFSKESAVLIVAAIVWYELVWWRERRLPLILGCVAVAVPIQAMLYQRSLALAADGPAEFPFTDNPLVLAGFWQAKLTAIRVMSNYLRLAVWPWKLSSDYSYNQVSLANGSVMDWVGWLVILAVAIAVLLLCRRNRLAFFFAGFAFLTFLPTSNLLFPMGTIMAERFLYLPLVGLLACLVMAVFAAGRRWKTTWLAPAILGILLCGFAVRTWARNPDWQDELTLARASAASSPRSFKTHQILAEALYASDPSHGNLQEVLGEAEKSLAILKPVPDARSTAEIYRFTGECYLTQGDRQGAAGTESYRRALAVLQRGAAILEASRARLVAELRAQGKPENLLGTSPNEDIYRLLAAAYFRLGDGDKAFDAAIESRKREPLNPQVYSQLGHILFAVHQPDDAATALMEGMLVTSDMGLRQELMNVYRGGLDRTGCAVVDGPRGPAINPRCGIVHKNLCDAALDAIRIRLETGHRDLAAELKRNFLHDYSCPAGPLNEVLPDAADSK